MLQAEWLTLVHALIAEADVGTIQNNIEWAIATQPCLKLVKVPPSSFILRSKFGNLIEHNFLFAVTEPQGAQPPARGDRIRH